MANTGNNSSNRSQRHRRIRATVSGTADQPRLSVYRSNRHMDAQIINDERGETLVAASSLELGLEDKPQTEQAEVVGETVAERAQDEGISQVVFDRGGYDYSGRVEALADAARSAGLDF